MSETPNHGYNTPSKGTTDWHIALNENFDAIDTQVEIRDTEARKSEYEPKQESKYEATDSGAVYYGDGSSWVLADREIKSVNVEEMNSIRWAKNSSDLVQQLSRAGDDASDNEPISVALHPKQYYITNELIVPPNVSLLGFGATLAADADTNILMLDNASRVLGPLKFDTQGVSGYSSSACVIDATRATTAPIRLRNDNNVVAESVTFKGTQGEGTALHLVGGDELGTYVTHCNFTITDIKGFSIGIHADTGTRPSPDDWGPGFLNDNHVYLGSIQQCDTAFQHDGKAEAKVLVHGGHIQGSTVPKGFVNNAPTNAGASIRWRGHVEDQHAMNKVISGPNMKIDTMGGQPNLQANSERYDMGLGTTIDGIGLEKADRNSPTPNGWRGGDMVMFQDTGDGSGTGIYLKTLEWGLQPLIPSWTPNGSTGFFE